MQYSLDINISEVNEKLFNQCYDIHKDFFNKKILCKNNVLISDIEKIFIKNNNGNIQIWTKNTNNISFKDILHMFNLIWLELNESKMQDIVFDNKDYNDFFCSKTIWSLYILPNEKKYKFYIKLIEDIAEIRHKIVHWKKIEIESSYSLEDVHLKIYLFKKYFVEKFLNLLLIEIKNYIQKEKYLSNQ